MKTFAFLLLITSIAFAEIKSGDSAPDFTLKNQDGKDITLADYLGKTVVLEWVNFGCPFVKKFYEVGEMQRLQTQAKKDGVIWLSINSSAKGKQGFFDKSSLKTQLAKEKITSSHYLLDTNGNVGRLYGAKVTPHMYVIGPKGTLVYQGAIDSIRSTKASDIPKAKNYIVEALKAVKAGIDLAKTETKAYGCGIKY
jgi:peroxiredoxin